MKNIANKITLSRMLLLIPTALCFILAQVLRDEGRGVYLGLLISATVIFSICCSTDFIDGHVARKYHCVSDIGKFLDPIVDKVNIAVMLFLIICFDDGLGAVFAYNKVVIAVLAGLIMTRELLVGMLRSIAAKRGAVIQSDITGKIKTIFLNIGTIVMLLAGANKVFAYISTIIFYIGAALTIFSGVHYFLKNKEALVDKVEDEAESAKENTEA